MLLNFTRFELAIDDYDQCTKDAVSIYDGNDDTTPLINTICARKFSVDPITSSGNMVFIYFESNADYRKHGFEIQYSSVEGKAGCIIKAI